jgi:hypothetical protein
MHDPMLLLTGVMAVVARAVRAGGDARSRGVATRSDRSRCGLDRAGALVRGCGDQRGGGGRDHLEPDPRHGQHPGPVAVRSLTSSGHGRSSASRRRDVASSARRPGAATSLAVALLTPMFVVLAFAAFQAALWSHARTEARVVARDTAALVARSGVAAGDARASATAVLEADTDLHNVAVEVRLDRRPASSPSP